MNLFAAFAVYNVGPSLFDFLVEVAATERRLVDVGHTLHPIAVDDASYDTATKVTLATLSRTHASLCVLRQQENMGVVQALRTALQHVGEKSKTGDLFAWLDADSEHGPAALSRLAAEITRGHDLALYQIHYGPGHLSRCDELFHACMGSLQGEAIFGEGQWLLHNAPGFWMVKAEHILPLLSAYEKYIRYFEERTGTGSMRWGEDLTVLYLARRLFEWKVSREVIAPSRLAAPNRPLAKIVQQGFNNCRHLMLLPEFVGMIKQEAK